MIKFIDILNEIKVNIPIPNNLKKLEALEQQIKTTEDPKVKKALAIQCAELVLPIWNYYHPNDKRVKQTIDDAKQGIDNGLAWNAANDSTMVYSADFYAAYAATYAAVDPVTTSNTIPNNYFILAVRDAILATKKHFNTSNTTPVIAENIDIPNIDYYQKILNSSNGLSIQSRQFYQKVINSIKKTNKASHKQADILRRIETGDFKYSPKNEIKEND